MEPGPRQALSRLGSGRPPAPGGGPKQGKEARYMHETILALAEAIASLSDRERPLLESLCACAEAQIAGRLSHGVAPGDCAEAFTCAAALYAAAGLFSCRGAGDVEQFTAGEVSLRLSAAGTGAAAALTRQADALMAPYWRDDAFAFLGVRG